MGKIGYILLLAICIIAALFGFQYWNTSRSHVEPPKTSVVPDSNQQEDFENAQSLIRRGKPKNAIKIIDRYKGEIESHSEWGSRWLDLLVEASTEIPDISQLVIIYRYRPAAFAHNEKASLMLAEAFLFTGKEDDYANLRNMWNGRETQNSEWLMVDADRLSLKGEWRKAITLLESQEFPPKEDLNRLIRLALLNMADNPKDSWIYLSRANDIDPNNAVVLSHRAMLLEMAGDNSEALSEYLAAASADPENMIMKQQLTDFFLRSGQYPQAVEVLENAILNPNADDMIWLNGLFWGRVIKPVSIKWEKVTPPNGKYLPVVQYFLNLKPWEFWNSEAFNKIEGHEKYFESLQPLWWMRLLSALKQNNEKVMMELLSETPKMDDSWNPNLVLAIQRIMNFKKNGSLALANEASSTHNVEVNSIAFFEKLKMLALDQKNGNQGKIPEEITALLKGPLAYTAALLATGWNEAAIDMQSVKVFPSNIPEWVVYLYAEALRENRDNDAAMEFVKLQNRTPSLDLLTAEMMVEAGKVEEATPQLEALSQMSDNIGMRASLLLSAIHLENENYEAAKEVVTKNEALASSTLGKEAVARIALLEGDDAQAEELYSEIEENSSEAQSFFARKAFTEGNWQRARDLTIELLKVHPNNAVLQQNLLKIQESQRSHSL